MKKCLLFLFGILCIGCKKESNQKQIANSLYVITYKQNKLSTGEFKNDRTNAIIRIWNEDDKNLEIKSSADAVDGYAYDKISSKSIMANYSQSGDHLFIKNIPPGKYFAFVIDTETTSVGRLAWSYIHFTISDNEEVQLEKVFGYSATSAMYEPWEANK